MRKLILSLVVGLVAVCGCARNYVITLSNGSQIGATGKPRLKDGYYCFKDAMGRQARVSAGRVTEIAPASMVESQKAPFKPTPAK